MSVRLHFNHLTRDTEPGTSLFTAAEALGIQVPTSCNKQGKCKECVVEVAEGMDLLSQPGPPEAHLKAPFRLSCCARIAAEEGSVRCHTMRRGEMRIEKHAFELPVHGPKWALEPAVTRDGERILLDGVEIERGAGPLHGLAVDLGTTTIVLRLLDLETGEVVADSSFENPQRFGGSDIMARIQYDTLDRTRTLQRTLAGYLSRAIEELPADPHSIYEVVLAGNSTMRDLFFKLSVYTIGQSPYQSVTEIEVASGARATTSLTELARRLGLPIHPRARVYGMPIISGHVGADAAACMLAVDIAHEDRVVAVMDIGTNTELLGRQPATRVLADQRCPRRLCRQFEGGQIVDGCPGPASALIEKVRLREGRRFREHGHRGRSRRGHLRLGSRRPDERAPSYRTDERTRAVRGRQGPVPGRAGGRPPGHLQRGRRQRARPGHGRECCRPADRVPKENTESLLGHRGVLMLGGGFGRNPNIESSKRIVASTPTHRRIAHPARSAIASVGEAA